MIESYVFNLGIEAAKTMNIIYSMSNATLSANSFYTGFQFVNTSSLINNAVRGLPQSTNSLTGPLLYQIAVARSFDTGIYFGSFPFIDGTSLSSTEITRYSKITPNITLSNIQMVPTATYEIVSEINQSDFTPSFLRNSSHYYDSQNFYFINYNNNFKISEYLSFGYSAYNKSTSNSTFGIALYNILQVPIAEINALTPALDSTFQNLIQQLALFSNISYNTANLLTNFSDNNIVVQESFLNFANINLSI